MDQSINNSIGATPTTRIRLYLRASNLPRSLIAQGYRQPDSFARVSVIAPRQDDDELLTEVYHREDGERGGLQDHVADETEVVRKSSNPRWTVSFSAQYEYGSQLLFFVEVFAVRGSGDAAAGEKNTAKSGESFFKGSIVGKVGKREIKLLGSAVFDVQDVLGTTSRVKSGRLRKGGVIYAHIEQQSSKHAPTSSISNNSTRAFDFRSSRNYAVVEEQQSPMLSLRLRGSSLIHTHSIQSRLIPTAVSKPDTFFEIARPCTFFEIARPSTLTNDWIVVYRSPSVKESLSPMWDEAVIPLDSLSSEDSDTQSVTCGLDQDFNAYPVRITVFKVKKKKCKAIGSFETTVQALIDSSLGVEVGTVENESDTAQSSLNELQFVSTIEDDHRGTFQLRPISTNATDSMDEITGFISVITARVGRDYSEMSNRFLNSDQYDDCSTTAPMEDEGPPNELNSELLPRTLASSNEPHNFIDYVNAGLNIDFCVAIDFTSSNGDRRDPGSLHYSRDGMMNDYEEAIESIGTTIGEYSTSKEFTVWGFGAKYDGEVRHIFQCGENPTATDIQGVLRAYRSVIETDLVMSEPTVILSVLRAAALRAKKFGVPPNTTSANKDLRYCVLLILTDGNVADLAHTQEIVQSYRDLPLSIVMVGIGRADFTEMYKWNSCSFEARGRFTFAGYRQNQYDPKALSPEALRRVPFDVRDYFLGKGIFP